MGDYAFDADTRVTACEPSGSFDAELTGRWNGTNGAVNGGYMLATCLRALSEAMPGWKPVPGNPIGGGFRTAPDAAALASDAPPPDPLEGMPTYTLADLGRACVFG